MRYISPYEGLLLLQNNGDIKYRFLKGVLDLGTGTIDASLSTTEPELSLNRPFKNDPLATTDIEKVGQGSLADGVYRNFYEAPLLTDGDIATVGDSLYYKVINGTIVYDGKNYYPGDTFRFVDVALLTTLATTDIVALDVPPVPQPVDINGEFKDQHLLYGDEPKDYYVRNEKGYEARSSVATADIRESGFGYIR